MAIDYDKGMRYNLYELMQGGGGGGGGYVLPPASTTRLGGIKVGSGLDVENDGTLSVDSTDIDNLEGEILLEKAAREQADNALLADFQSLERDFVLLDQQLRVEIGERRNADNAINENLQDISNNLDQEVNDRATAIRSLQSTKQDTLISGSNIKTVNGNSLLGSGNLSIAQNAVVNDDTNIVSDFGLESEHLTASVTISELEDTTPGVYHGSAYMGTVYDNAGQPDYAYISFYDEYVSIMGSLNPSKQCVTLGNLSDPQNDFEAVHKAYLEDMLINSYYDFTDDYNPAITIYPITNTMMPSVGTGRLTIDLPSDMQTDWKIVGLAKLEVKDGNNAIEAIITRTATYNNGNGLYIFVKTTGNANISATHVRGTLILTRR